jgi:hypothetical protein
VALASPPCAARTYRERLLDRSCGEQPPCRHRRGRDALRFPARPEVRAQTSSERRRLAVPTSRRVPRCRQAARIVGRSPGRTRRRPKRTGERRSPAPQGMIVARHLADPDLVNVDGEVDLRRPARRRSTLRRPTGGADLRNCFRPTSNRALPKLTVRNWRAVLRRPGRESDGLRAELSAPAPISRQNDAARPGGRRRQEPMNRSFLIPSALIFDSNVEPGMPSFAAAPDGPDTRPLLEARASSIICRSRATSSSASG